MTIAELKKVLADVDDDSMEIALYRQSDGRVEALEAIGKSIVSYTREKGQPFYETEVARKWGAGQKVFLLT